MKKKSPRSRGTKSVGSKAMDQVKLLQILDEYKQLRDGQLLMHNNLFDSASKGSVLAFQTLVQLSLDINAKIGTLTTSNFDIARQIARRMPLWPTLLGPSPHFGPDPRELVKRLELGKESPISMDLKRAFRETTPARMLAISLIFLTDHLRMLGDSLTTKIIMESRIPELHKVKTKEAKAVAEQTEMVINRDFPDGLLFMGSKGSMG
jgi:hypothetical protein